MFDADTSTFDDPRPDRLRVGDHVMVGRDVLAELGQLGRDGAGLPPTWFCIPAGTRGKLIGWRDRGEDSRAIIDLEGTERRVVVLIGEEKVVQSRAPRRYRPRHRC